MVLYYSSVPNIIGAVYKITHR